MLALGDATWIALGGFAVAIVLIWAVVAIVFRRPGASINAKLGNLAVTVGSIHDALNDRLEGAPTISQQVTQIAARVNALDEKVADLARDLGAHILANPGLPAAPRGPGYPRYGN